MEWFVINNRWPFQLDDEDNPNYVEITELLANVSEPETSAQFQRMKSIGNLLLPKLDQYYTYHGSLTTPPCSEVVTWIDFKQSIPLSHAQVILEYAFFVMAYHYNHNQTPRHTGMNTGTIAYLNFIGSIRILWKWIINCNWWLFFKKL